MVLIPVLCPHCHSDAVIKGGKTKAGIQRYKCLNATSSIKAAALRSKHRSSTWRPWERHSRYSTGVEDQPNHSSERAKKKSPRSVV